MRNLTEAEVKVLADVIVRGGYVPTYEYSSMHIYQTWYEIDGKKYTLCQAVYEDVLPWGWEIE